MKPTPPPVVEQDAAARTEALLRKYAGWPAPGVPATGAGAGLVHAFAHVVDEVAERINRVPEKNLLAFLELVGVRPAPAGSARAPLTFMLAKGATSDGFVPAGSRVAAEAPGGGDPPVFETERDLVVTPAELQAVLTRDPLRDRVGDHGTGESGPFGAFAADTPIVHRLYVGHDLQFGLAERAGVTVTLLGVQLGESWTSVLDWERWDGSAWVSHPTVTRRPTAQGGGLANVIAVDFAELPEIPFSTIAGSRSRWVRARLGTSIPRLGPPIDTSPLIVHPGAVVDAFLANGVVSDGRRPVTPFVTDKRFFIRIDEVFSKEGATLRLTFSLAPTPVTPTNDLKVRWQYFDDGQWKLIGESTPVSNTQIIDNTVALTRGGTVEFFVRAGWDAGGVPPIPGTEPAGRWLLAEAVTGGFGMGPPTITSVRAAYEWPRPRLNGGAQVAGSLQRAGRELDQATYGATDLDLSKDFLPFGAQPATGDVFYFACDDATRAPRSMLRFDVVVTSPVGTVATQTPPPAVANHGLLLQWEYFHAANKRWTKFGEWGPNTIPGTTAPFLDGTEALAKSGTIMVIPVPATAAPPSNFLSAAGMVEVNGVLRRWLRARIARGDYTPDPSTATPTPKPQPPSIKSFTVAYGYSSLTTPSNATIATENEDALAVREPSTFHPFSPSPDREPTLYLGFDRAFSNRPISLYFSVRDDVSTEAGPAAGPPAVVWEFWDGAAMGWGRLETRDDTRAFTRRGLVTFVGPSTLVASRQFGRSAHWLRARWVAGGYSGPPTLERVATNTMWALHQTTILDEVLGSSTGASDQALRATRAPMLDGEMLDVRESEDAGAAWVRWERVVDFHLSGPADRHYTVTHATGEIRFGNGLRGRIPPRGRSNIRLARYRTGGGDSGNCPPAAISRLLTTLPYVDKVSNRRARRGRRRRRGRSGGRRARPASLASPRARGGGRRL